MPGVPLDPRPRDGPARLRAAHRAVLLRATLAGRSAGASAVAVHGVVAVNLPYDAREPGDLGDPSVVAVLNAPGERFDGREIVLRESDLPSAVFVQPGLTFADYAAVDLANGEQPPLPQPIEWRWTGRTDSHARAVFERS